jgi:hypothetical protein
MKNKEIINEHDLTKKMLETIRDSFLINEADEGTDVISPSQNDEAYTEELKKISDTVDPRVQVTKFKIYPKDRDVQFDGRLDSGINFSMSIRAMKLSISITDENGKAKDIFVDKELLGTLQKLNGYYENWTREWAKKLNTEYKPK